MKKWLKRIGVGICCACASFVIVSIMHKLVFAYDEWLYRSVMMSAPWFVITLLKYYFIVDKGWKQWKLMLTVATTTLIATLFIAGVCLSRVDCWSEAIYFTFCFAYPTVTIPPNDI